MASPFERLYSSPRRPAGQLRLPQLAPEGLQRFAFGADLNHEHATAAVVWLTLGPIVAMTAWLGFGRWHAAVIVGFLVGVPLVLAFRWSGRRTRRLVNSLPDVIDVIGRSLRSGATFSQALREAAGDAPDVVGHELQQVISAAAVGRPYSQALRDWSDRVRQSEVRIVAATLALASENEAGTMQALDGVSQSLRDRAALAAEVRAHTAQAAASMQALVLLPIGFLAIDALGSQRTIKYLTSAQLGQICLLAGLALNVVGWAWMTSIVRRRMPA